MHCVHLVIRGHVQGVGFRYFAYRKAEARRLTGWVRNRPDGTVEVEAEGPRESLEAWIRELRQGPSAAVVMDVRETWSESDPRHIGFEMTG